MKARLLQWWGVLYLGSVLFGPISQSVAEPPPKNYRVSYPPLPLGSGGVKLNERGEIYWMKSTPSGSPTGYPVTTEFRIYRPSRETGKPIGVQIIPGPITPWMGPYSLVAINEDNQFVCSETSNGAEQRFLWNGATFIRLLHPVILTEPAATNIAGTALSPTSLDDGGTVWGTTSEISGLGTSVDFGGTLKWSPDGTPTVNWIYTARPGFTLTPRNSLGQMLRYTPSLSVSDLTFWNGASELMGSPIFHPPSQDFLLNDKNQVAGIDAATGEFWLHLPTADYGLPAGLNRLSGTERLAGILFNNSGQIVSGGKITGTPPIVVPPAIWDKGKFVTPILIDPDGASMLFASVFALNDRGMILAHVFRNGTPVLAQLTPTDLDVTATVIPPRLAVGEEFDLQLTIRNNLDITLQQVGILLPSMYFSGAVLADWVKAPPALLTLAPGASGTLRYSYRTKALGKMRVQFQLQGFDAGNNRAALTESLASPEITVSPPLELVLTPSTNLVDLGEQFQVAVQVRNNTSRSISNIAIQPGTLATTGLGGVTYESGPTPALADLPAGASQTVTYRFEAAVAGLATFQASGTGRFSDATLVTAPLAMSPPVRIVTKGDLLIKRATESPARFAIDNEYQTNPAGAQVRTNTIALGERSEFHVRMQNDGRTPQMFALKIREETDPGWQLKYLFNGSDISAVLRATGMTFPELPSNATHTVTIRMTPTNAVPGDPMRVLLQLEAPTLPGEILDIVEAVTEVVVEIIVNSTGDEPDADVNDNVPDVDLLKPGLQTTLRCAIDFANRKAGKDIIKFEIPASDPNYRSGYPLIQPATAFSNIVDSVIIDGWSQDLSSSLPVIEIDGMLVQRPEILHVENQVSFGGLLNWNGAASGLDIQARDCEIHGLSIYRFPLCGLRLRAGGTVIQGNHLGFSLTGSQTIPAANGSAGLRSREFMPLFFVYHYLRGAGIGIESDNNLIGGSGGGRQGNVVSGMFGHKRISFYDSYTTPPGILITGAGAIGNQVEGNLIGLNPNGENVFTDPEALKNRGIPVAGVVIADNARFNSIGSIAAGNVIANSTYGIVLDGGANENIVVNNLIGTDPGGKKIMRYHFSPVDPWFYLHHAGILVLAANNNVLGGESPSEGNYIGGWREGIHLLRDENTMVKNNLVGTTSDGFAIPNLTGIRAVTSYLSEIRSNNISLNQVDGVLLDNNTELTIAGNQIRSNGFSGIYGGSDMNTVIAQNTISANGALNRLRSHGGGDEGITLVGSGQFHISRNLIYDNAGLGISFNHLQYTNDIGDSDSGPNGLQNHPAFYSPLNPQVGVTLSGNQLHVKGGLSSKAGVYSIEFFFSPNADPTGFGEGRIFLGSVFINVGFGGEGVIDTLLTTTAAVGEFFTATATDSDKNTSLFSRAVMIQDCVPGISGLCPGTEAQVPSRPAGSIQTAGGEPSGDGNGDGIQDSLQDNVASFPTFSGLWMTLATSNGAVFKAVMPMGLADFPTLPANHTFPVSLLGFAITNLPVNSSIVVTNFLHLNAAANVEYTATTFFNYGPTPENLTPHWYEFNFDGTTGAQLFSNRIVLHFQDGARGDNDLVANGEIVTTGGPATFQIIPPGPLLSVQSAGFEPGFAFGSNAMLTVIALAWPENATNYIVETTDNLSPASIWEPVFDVPVLANGQLVLTNTFSDPQRFFRLRRLLYLDAFLGLPTPAAPLLTIQRTSTDTFLLSWPSSFTGFALQQNTNLVAGNWATVTNTVSVSSGQHQVLVAPAADSRFFRLRTN